MWVCHENTFAPGAVDAAAVLQGSGFLSSKIYGNAASIARQLRLPLLGDNIRFLQMGLLAQELNRKQIPGAIAELGVCRGGFTKFISRAFFDRIYYLFDTFEGFEEQQIQGDTAKFGANGHDFSDTSVEQVLKAIDPKSPCEVVVRKGIFPDTAEGVNDTFAFVSLGADRYESTIEELRFFCPRMSNGGYIMVHDLMASRYKGFRRAVYEFCDDEGISFIPLPDAICSALIVKQR